MKEYVLAFLFTPDYKNVWLMEKQRPDWQKGSLNGLGGKVEDGENPKLAIIRELKEEANFQSDPLKYLGLLQGTNNDNTGFKVHVYTGITTEQLETMEDEPIRLFSLDEYKNFPYIENIPVLIEACLYKLRGHSHFSELTMRY